MHCILTRRSIAPNAAACLALTVLLLGCGERKANPTAAEIASFGPATAAVATDKWLGQWAGPEGTFLRLAGGNGKYEITIQNLDGPRTYPGVTIDNQVQFERGGTKELIRATNGSETGMKWLTEKSNCLTVRPGEGYCRD